MQEGVYYGFPEEGYHKDPAIEPSLSAGLIKTLLNASPLHAWFKHPRLNGEYETENKTAFDVGSAAHSLILNDPKKFEIVDAADWRKNENKDKRDAAYISGKIPLLVHQWQDIQEMVKSSRAQLCLHECEDAFNGRGQSEVTLIWQEGGIWCRCRIDYVAQNLINFYDYKTTGQSANPEYASRTLFTLGYDITSAFYKRGIRKLFGVENPNYRFVIQETSKPFALSVLDLDPMAEAIADRKIDAAIALWSKCLRSGEWPGYAKRVAYASMPSYMETAWLAREEQENAD